MSTVQLQRAAREQRRRVRNNAFGLAAVALAFYFGIMILLVYRSRH